MPAAAWAARSGDPVLFTGRDEVPEATIDALERHRGVPDLRPRARERDLATRSCGRSSGPRRASSGSANRTRSRTRSPSPATPTPASAGTSTTRGTGWCSPTTSRPLDAAAAATLSASGKWGPLLVTEDAATLSRRAAKLPARHQARLRGRSHPRRVQPRLADRRRLSDRRQASGRGRRARGGRRSRPGRRRAGGRDRGLRGHRRSRTTGPRTSRSPDRAGSSRERGRAPRPPRDSGSPSRTSAPSRAPPLPTSRSRSATGSSA